MRRRYAALAVGLAVAVTLLVWSDRPGSGPVRRTGLAPFPPKAGLGAASRALLVRVDDEDEKRPVEGARVEATLADGTKVRATTGVEGFARFDRLPADCEGVVVIADGYAPSAPRFGLERTSESRAAYVRLRRLRAIEVRIVAAESGAPIAGAKCVLWDAQGGISMAGRTGWSMQGPIDLGDTDAAGAIAMPLRRPGLIHETRYLTVTAAGRRRGEWFVDDRDPSPPPWTLRMEPGGALEGTVASAGGRPVAGASIYAEGAYDDSMVDAGLSGNLGCGMTEIEPTFDAETDAEGRWRMDGVRTGAEYYVIASREGFEDVRELHLRVDRGTTPTRWDAVLRPRAPGAAPPWRPPKDARVPVRAHGVVVGVHGRPLAGVPLVAIGGATVAVTDDEGRFDAELQEWSQLEVEGRADAPGTRKPVPVSKDGSPLRIEAATWLDTEFEAQLERIREEPRGREVVRGRVVDEEGRGIAGTSVRVFTMNPWSEAAARTESDGTYEAKGLMPGPWERRISADGYLPYPDSEGPLDREARGMPAPEPEDATEPGANKPPSRIVLVRAARVRVTVVDERGVPYGCAHVHARMEDPPPKPGPRVTEKSVWTRMDGTVEVLVAPGRWVVSVGAADDRPLPTARRVEARTDRPALVLLRFPAR